MFDYSAQCDYWKDYDSVEYVDRLQCFLLGIQFVVRVHPTSSLNAFQSSHPFFDVRNMALADKMRARRNHNCTKSGCPNILSSWTHRPFELCPILVVYKDYSVQGYSSYSQRVADTILLFTVWEWCSLKHFTGSYSYVV